MAKGVQEYLGLRGKKLQDTGLVTPTKHSSGDQIKEDEMGATCGMHEREETRTQGISCRPEGNRAVGRIMHRWENNIKMDFK